jgi:ChrB-like protein
MAEHQWLLFTPQTPTAPSSLRVTVWRRLQSAGAVSVQQGVWMVPFAPEHEHKLREIRKELQAQGGNGLLFVATPLDAEAETQLVARFQEERATDYAEFADRCQAFFQEIEKETKAEHFSFAELEEIEEDLAKLTSWFRKIQGRDFFPGKRSEEATQLLTRCRQMLDTFTHAVYTAAGLSPQDE